MKEPAKVTAVSHPPKQWEYRIVTATEMMEDARGNRTRVRDRLNQYGAEGWELVTVLGEPYGQKTFYLKRG
jgi:Domain of unknown function (DUF4177)